MQQNHSTNVVTRFFTGLAEQTFQVRLGVVDPRLIDYVSDLLVRFVHTDAVYSLRNPRGKKMRGVAEMRSEADARIGEARREAHRQIGDFTLFWMGVYPEALKSMQNQSRTDHLLNYRSEGKRAYFVASTIPATERKPRRDVLQRLSDEFELCAYGLGEIRREWERRDDEGSAPAILVDHD